MTQAMFMGAPEYGADRTKVGTDDALRSFYTVPGFLQPQRMGGGATTWTPVGGGRFAPRDAYGQSENLLGAWWEWDIPIRPPSEPAAEPIYGFMVNYCAGPNLGAFDVSWDGFSMGAAWDSYAAAYQFGSIYTGFPVGFDVNTPKLHTCRLTMTGKNAASTGYFLLLGSISIYDIPA